MRKKFLRNLMVVTLAMSMVFATGCSSNKGDNGDEQPTSTTEAPSGDNGGEDAGNTDNGSTDNGSADSGSTEPAKKVLSLSFEGNVEDGSGNGINGTLNKEGTYVEGVNGQALYFDGATYIDMGTSTALQPANLSFSAWIKADGTLVGEHIITWFKPNGNYQGEGWYLSCLDASTPLKISVGKSTGQPYELYVMTDRNQFFPDGEWVHVVVTYNSTTKQATMYRNGEALEVKMLNSELTINADETSNKYIGFNSPTYNGGFAKMTMDEIEIYDGVLTPEEVAALYSANAQ